MMLVLWMIVMLARNGPLFRRVAVGERQVLHAPTRLAMLPSHRLLPSQRGTEASKTWSRQRPGRLWSSC